ncbi:MAG TPA: hypothetical protein VHG91_02435 [Longimicrobium sp.]|nr:hypothetical protein [Longimicrobium sp.]
MFRSPMSTALALMLCSPGIPLTATPGHAQAGRFIECRWGTLNSDCEAHLETDQKKVAVAFRMREHLPRPATATLVASECCVDSTSVAADANGFVSFTWAGESAPKKKVTIRVIGSTSNPEGITTPWEEQIALIPPDEEKLRTMVVSPLDTTDTYVWLRNTFVPTPIHVEVNNIGGSPSEEGCAKLRFAFQALLEGKATPDSGRARLQRSSRHPFHPVCVVETRWKLSDGAGRQHLELTLGDDKTFKTRRVRIAGIARQGPRLAAGLGFFSNIRRDDRIVCRTVEQHDKCRDVKAADLPKEITIGGRNASGMEPYFGLELPIFLRNEPDNIVERLLYQHTRILVGTTFERPEENYFIGVALLPILSSAAEESPFQITMGLGAGFRGMYGGMSLDAAVLVKPILSVFGVAGF